MSAFLLRRWFLLLLLAGATLALVRPAWLGWMGKLAPRGIVGSALFLMAWTLPTRRLLDTFTRPWAACWAVLISYLLLPGLSWGVGWLLPADFRIGLLISASVPCTLASAVLWTRRAGGDEPTTVLVIFLSTLTSCVATTAWLSFAGGREVTVNAPEMMTDLALTLIVPFALGQGARTVPWMAELAARHRTVLGVVAQLLILSILLKAAVHVGERLAEGSLSTAPGAVLAVAAACLGVHLAALSFGLFSSRGLRLERPRQIAVAFACSQKTLPVAMLLFERHFQAAFPLAVLPLAFYHFGQLVADTLVADALAGRKPVPALPAEEVV
jgi:sodium/bile acid cotransporter 7